MTRTIAIAVFALQVFSVTASASHIDECDEKIDHKVEQELNQYEAHVLGCFEEITNLDELEKCTSLDAYDDAIRHDRPYRR